MLYYGGMVMKFIATVVLLTTALGAQTQKIPGGSSSGMTLVQSLTASSSATLDFTSCITSKYDTYVFELDNLMPGTDLVELHVRFSTNGGTSWDSSATYVWWGTYQTPGSNSPGGFYPSSWGVPPYPNVTEMKLNDTTTTGSLGNSSNSGLTGTLTLYAPLNSGKHKTFQGSYSFIYADPGGSYPSNLYGIPFWQGYYASNTPVNGVRFYMSSGNIASGVIRCYGISK